MSNSKNRIKNKKRKKKEKVANSLDLFDRLDQFFDKNGQIFFWIGMFFTLLFSFLLFNFRVSEAGDDSAYILRAFDFVKELKFPTFQGPLYPIILSFFILIFGLNVTLLKTLSLIFILVHLYFFYRAFKGRVSSFLLIFVIIIISFNGHLLYYSSQTYSEAFYLMLQAIFFYYFFRFFVSEENSPDIKNNWGKYMILGTLLLSLGLTRSIGYGGFLSVAVFFILTLRWRALIYSTGGFIINYGVFGLIKRYLFNINTSQFDTQINRLMQKNPFDVSEGKEDFFGFIVRFWDNSNLYLSKHLFKFIGIRPEATDIKVFLTILVYILFIVAIYFAFKKNRYLLFTGIYLAVLIGITFIIVQARWDQSRLVIIYLPLILLFLFSGIYYLSKIKSLKIIQGIFPVVLVILFFSNLSVTIDKVKENEEYLTSHLYGDKFYGMTPDWVNYIKMSQWAAKNIPEDQVIACRKPSISFIYAKRKFYGIYRIETQDPDELFQELKDNNVRYVIMANLRKYPKQKTEYTINTVKRYLYYIQQKYPQRIKFVKEIGADEKAYLFEIVY